MKRFKIKAALIGAFWILSSLSSYAQEEMKENENTIESEKAESTSEMTSKEDKSTRNSGGFVFSINPNLSYWELGDGNEVLKKGFKLKGKIGYGIEGSVGYSIKTSVQRNITIALFYGIGNSPTSTKSLIGDGIYQNAELGLIISNVLRISSGFAYSSDNKINSTTIDFRNMGNERISGFNLGFQILHEGLLNIDVVVPKLGYIAYF